MLDSLEMLVTSDPVAELDAALTQAATRRQEARANGDILTVQYLSARIDHRLDQRLDFDRRDY